MDGLPMPAREVSDGVCSHRLAISRCLRVLQRHLQSDRQEGRQYTDQVVSGSPITLRRRARSAPTIRKDPYQ